jgi:hypothetical protein
LFQGYIHNNNAALTATLGGIPAGSNYSLILYSVGFTFNTTYEQQVDLTGAAVYPSLHVQAQDASQYIASPGYVRMSSTDPNARDHGNYVQFDNVSPAADGTLTILITPSRLTRVSPTCLHSTLQLIKVVLLVLPTRDLIITEPMPHLRWHGQGSSWFRPRNKLVARGGRGLDARRRGAESYKHCRLN